MSNEKMGHSLTIGAIVAILIAVALIFYGSASTESEQISDSHNYDHNEYQNNHDEYNSHDEYGENGHDYGEYIDDNTYEI